MDTLDLRGLRCPLPLLRLKQGLHQRAAGVELTVYTSDTGARRDIPAFLRQAGHELLAMSESADGETCFVIRKEPG